MSLASSLLSFTLAAATDAPNLFVPHSAAPWLEGLKSSIYLLLFLMAGLAALLGYQDWKRNRLILKAIRRLELPPSARLLETELAKLRERDPGFSPEAFLKQVGELFAEVRSAQLAGQPPPRHRVSDGIWRRAVAEHAIEHAQGSRRVHVDSVLREARLVGAFCDPHFDALHVRLAWTSHLAEIPVDLPPAEAPARASKADSLQAEVWVFVRRPTAKTLQGGSPGKCPNCGAPFDGGAANLCTHCKAILNSGSYDWVLSQVVDFEVYRGPWREFTGLAEMVARDPAFSPEAVEDRAALLFWKWMHARSEREPARARRLCAPELAAELEAEAASLRGRGARRWLGELAVAGVDLLLMELDDDENRDQVCLRVRWSGKVAEFGDDARPQVARSSYATVLTLVRESGATTDLKTGVSSDRCHACHAANDDSEAAQCSYCGAPLEPVKHDFVLRDACSFETWMARRHEHAALAQAVSSYVPAFKFADERLRLLQMMAALARADGEVDRAERALLKVCCRRWAVSFLDVRPVLDGEVAAPELKLEKESWAARAFLEALCDAAAIDGVIDSKERSLLTSVARHLGLPPPTTLSLKTRAEHARRALREARAD